MEWIERERNNVADLEWKGTKLLGRRPETRKVLEEAAADAVCCFISASTATDARQIRPHLPPRQRLASKWNLLCALHRVLNHVLTPY